MNETHTGHANTPKNHDKRQEYTWSHLLEKHISQWLKDRIADEEDGQTVVVLAIGHAQILLETVDLCVANIGTIEKTD